MLHVPLRPEACATCIVTDVTGSAVPCKVAAIIEDGDDLGFDCQWLARAIDHGLVIDGMLPGRRYDVTINVCDYTNVVIKDVQPGMPAVNIVVPCGVRVTGCIQDTNNRCAFGWVRVGMAADFSFGEFMVSPVYPGLRQVRMGRFITNIMVGTHDVDLGILYHKAR